MAQKILVQGRRGERGQTIVLVAVSILSLLAMAALAVDVITLYVAKGQIQHAADAAALAGAKAFVESTITSVPPGDPSYATLQTIAQNIACPDATCSSGYIGQALTQNPVSGSPAVISSHAYDWTYPGNPRITVSLQRTNLPIFFARIWSSALASVSATATAEAYNPWNSQTQTGALIPVAPQCVKPILVSNSGPGDSGATNLSTPFVNKTDGTPAHPGIAPSGGGGFAGSGGFIGQEIILSYQSCVSGPKPCVPYLPQVVSGTPNFPSACSTGTQYEQSVASCEGKLYDFSQCGESATAANVDPADPSGSGGATQTGAQCLIHATGPGLGNGQDVLDISDFLNDLAPPPPIQIQAGNYSNTKLGVAIGSPISTSDSIVTLPIYTNRVGNTVTIVGFLHAFVNSTGPANGDLDVTILNVAGCGPGSAIVPAVSGGGISPVPVRLITPP